MSIRNIIFDWDGTLAKTLDLWLEGYRISFHDRGHRFDAKFIVEEFFHNHHEVPARYPDLEFPTVAEETRSYVFEGLAKVDLYEGAKETLEILESKGVTLSLVTSSARRLLDRALDAHELRSFFASVVAGDDGFGHKPSDLPFRETLDRIGAAAAETLVIGDSHVDIQAGKSIGCQTCWFAPEHNSLFHDFEHLESLCADHQILRVSELAVIV